MSSDRPTYNDDCVATGYPRTYVIYNTAHLPTRFPDLRTAEKAERGFRMPRRRATTGAFGRCRH